MKNFLSYRESFYYDELLRVDLVHKHTVSDILNSIMVSAVITRKTRFLDSSFVKVERLLQLLTKQRPQSYLTNSFVTLRSTVTRSRLADVRFFLLNYLYETGRYTITPISVLYRQANFSIRDYVYLGNFLGAGYDYFGWKFPLRLTFNFLSVLKDKDFKFFFHLLIVNES